MVVTMCGGVSDMQAHPQPFHVILSKHHLSPVGSTSCQSRAPTIRPGAFWIAVMALLGLRVWIVKNRSFSHSLSPHLLCPELEFVRTPAIPGPQICNRSLC